MDTSELQSQPQKRRLSYAESAQAIREIGQKIAQDPQKAREFLREIGLIDEHGKLAEGFR